MSREFKLFGGWDSTPATVWSVAPGKKARRQVIITYSVNRRPYSSEVSTARPLVQGQIFSLRYDPSKPQRNELLVRQYVRQACLWGGLVLAIALAIYYVFMSY